MNENDATQSITPQPRIESERICLRPFRLEDAAAVFPLVSDKEIAANTRTIPHPYPEDGAEKWINTLGPEWEEGKSAVFAICLKESETEKHETLVGAIGLIINKDDENAELGYWLGRPFWNQGICSEASRLIIGFGFESLGLEKIHAHHMIRNPASGKVMIHSGMKCEGLLRKHIKKWGIFEDVAFYGILREDWEANTS